MATDKDKGIVDSASDGVRETTGVLRGEGPWHSANSDVTTTTPTARPATASHPRTSYRVRAARHSAKSANGSTSRVVR